VMARLEGLEVEYDGHKIPCRFSRGWTDYRSGETAEQLMKRADETLYANKRATKPPGGSLRPTIVQQSVS
jgi:hypothetical protein